jgi:P-type Mg2+ transporter
MIVSVTLANGAVRMAAKGDRKRLAMIENLGSMDILCSHKTGTLTLVRRRSTAGTLVQELVLGWTCGS